tara:strand:- start:417 stop:572 length:156 start_codon:yes stop_codon:yes gene_type:complete
MTDLEKLSVRMDSLESIIEMLVKALEEQNAALGAIQVALGHPEDNRIVVAH